MTHPRDTPDDNHAATVAELVDRARISMLTTMTEDGRHVSRPMALQDVEFDGDLWFFTDEDSDKIAQIRTNAQVNVSFANEKDSEWASLSGTASIEHDRAKMEELWAPALRVWFPEGLETPGIALLKVAVDTAEYWDASSSTIKKLAGGLRAALTGNPDAFPADNQTVRL